MALLIEKGALPKTVEPKEEQHLSIEASGNIKGLGEMMSGLVREAPDSPEANESVETEPVKADSTPPPNTPAPEVKRKLKWNGQEIEVAEKDIEALAQQGFDYTKKTQALAEKERSLAPVEGLSKQIQSDPRFAAYVYSYFNQQQGRPQSQAPVHVEAPPEDPVARLKWEIRQDLLKDIQGVEQKFSQAVAPITQQQMVTRTVMEVMKDPMYPQVQAKLLEYVQGLPPYSQRMEFNRIDQDPVSYTEMYDHFRKQISATPPVQPPPSGPTQSGVTRTPSAPLLESSGPGGPPLNKADTRKEKMSKAKARILASGNTEALSDWIRESGISDMLKGPV